MWASGQAREMRTFCKCSPGVILVEPLKLRILHDEGGHIEREQPAYARDILEINIQLSAFWVKRDVLDPLYVSSRCVVVVI